MGDIASYLNSQDLGPLENGFQDDAPPPVLGTPTATVATCWWVAGGVAGGATVAGAYTLGRNVN